MTKIQNEYGITLDKNGYAESIIQWNTGEQCGLCGKTHCDLARHEVFHGNGRRELSKHYGLWLTLCPTCHNYVHKFPAEHMSMELVQQAQHQAMEKYEWSTKDFISVFGKNYL